MNTLLHTLTNRVLASDKHDIDVALCDLATAVTGDPLVGRRIARKVLVEWRSPDPELGDDLMPELLADYVLDDVRLEVTEQDERAGH